MHKKEHVVMKIMEITECINDDILIQYDTCLTSDLSWNNIRGKSFNVKKTKYQLGSTLLPFNIIRFNVVFIIVHLTNFHNPPCSSFYELVSINRFVYIR